MNLKKEFNRLSGMFGEGLERVSDMTDELGERMRDETETLTKRARKGLSQLQRKRTTGEKLDQHVREHSTIYLFVALALLGMFLARLMATPPPPVDREW